MGPAGFIRSVEALYRRHHGVTGQDMPLTIKTSERFEPGSGRVIVKAELTFPGFRLPKSTVCGVSTEWDSAHSLKTERNLEQAYAKMYDLLEANLTGGSHAG